MIMIMIIILMIIITIIIAVYVVVFYQPGRALDLRVLASVRSGRPRSRRVPARGVILYHITLHYII